MKLKLDETINILQQEINWCLDHPDKDLSKDAQMGFMNGLRQAQYLIRAGEQSTDGSVVQYRHHFNPLITDDEETTLLYTQFVNGTISGDEFHNQLKLKRRE